jgi:cell division GTPase FtsZ
MADDVLRQSQGITDLIVPGLVNLDFADVRDMRGRDRRCWGSARRADNRARRRAAVSVAAARVVEGATGSAQHHGRA